MFLGIFKYGMTKPIPAGWVDATNNRRIDEIGFQYQYFLIDKVNKLIYSTPRITIYFNGNHYITSYFQSDKEALDYIECLISKNRKLTNFVLI